MLHTVSSSNLRLKHKYPSVIYGTFSSVILSVMAVFFMTTLEKYPLDVSRIQGKMMRLGSHERTFRNVFQILLKRVIIFQKVNI